MTDAQRAVLSDIAKSQTAAYREVQRAKALLMAADGLASYRIAALAGMTPASVGKWRARFAEEGLRDFGRVRKGRGRKPSIPAEKIEAIVQATTTTRPAGAHALELPVDGQAQGGVSPATVQRIWSARGLKPHRVKTFKLSNDPRFEEKLVDVVGLYLNPPDNGDGAVHGREEPDPGAGPHPAVAADETRPGRHDDPRLQAHTAPPPCSPR